MIVFAVDMFDEGVDVPSIDTVLMFRQRKGPFLVPFQVSTAGPMCHSCAMELWDYVTSVVIIEKFVAG
ncbi:hypothetical protein C7U60_04125 [Mesorhizobium plurifarium]|nr:hypothetical protein C7U60_04125 [Mesorhizobium plurifarium]